MFAPIAPGLPASTRTCAWLDDARRLMAIAASLICLLPFAASAQTMATAAVPTEANTLGVPFATRHARFEPVAFDQIPGWRTDNLQQSLKGLRQSCNALARKPAWSDLCAEANSLAGAGVDSIRLFFERNFFAYHVMSPEKQTEGLITGYFEPVLAGSRVRGGAFRYPVYGQPNDLLLLDASAIDGGISQRFRIKDGRLLVADSGDTSARAYAVDLSATQPNIRDKRFRVRVEGNRILPYYSRQEIERRQMDAPVLAWVSNPFQLYSMQVQGSGKIRMQDGRIIRVGFAEQNGYPFLPRGNTLDVSLASRVIKTRGLQLDNTSAGAGLPRLGDQALARMIADLDAQPDRAAAADPAPPPMPDQALSSPFGTPEPAVGDREEVERIVALLAAQRTADRAGPAAQPPAAQTGVDDVTSEPTDPGSAEEVAAIIAALSSPVDRTRPRRQHGMMAGLEEEEEPAVAGPAPTPVARSGAAAITNIPDPSYVFFRGIADGPQGPVGALGVPLTAGRSLAVDPRTTPLGSPVFISTSEPGGGGRLDRLMFAQDTGGAIRGSVRGDLFWGTGETAGRLALATNDSARMWLLLPRGQTLSSLKGIRTRGSGVDALPDCVVDDPDLCVEQ